MYTVKEFEQIADIISKSRLKNDVAQSIGSSEIHLELMSSMKVITSHATNIARILLEWTNNVQQHPGKNEQLTYP